MAIVVTLLALVPRTTYGAIEYGTDNRSVGARYQLLPLSPERISEGTDYKFIPNQIDAYTQASISVSAVDWAHQDQWGPSYVSAYAEANQQSYYNPSELYFSGIAFLGDVFNLYSGTTLDIEAFSNFILEFTVDMPTDYTLTAQENGAGFTSFVLLRRDPTPEVLIGSFTPALNGTLIAGLYYVEFILGENLIGESGIKTATGGSSGLVQMTFTTLQSPLVLSAVSLSAAGQLGLSASGAFGQVVVLEASPDLRTWTPLQTNTLAAVPLLFSDPQPASLPARFYRARSGP